MAFARSISLVLVLGACSSAAAPASTRTTEAAIVIVPNQGGGLEGHTPRGFAGMGAGLFAGDNLNAGFPDGDGVQSYLTFQPTSVPESVSSASLSSQVLQVRGTPFEDLGTLLAERVVYESFGRDLFDLDAASDPTPCERVGEIGIRCDVTDAVRDALDSGVERLQFRLRFDRAGDGDGAQDLAMFFVTDSNTNESGIFTLTIEP